MRNLLLPQTDAGVAVQTAIAVVLFGAALWRSWRSEARLLVVGVGVAWFAWTALRAAH